MSIIPAQPNTQTPEWLFGEHLATLKKYFERLKSFRSENGQQIPLIVYYGTPSTAYRQEVQTVGKLVSEGKLNQNYNGKARLPFLNFFGSSWKRKLIREPITRPYVLRYEADKEKYLKTQVPFIFDMTVNCSLWAANYRERDDLLFKFYNLFPRNEISLPHIPDKKDPYHSGSLINIVLNEDMTDATEIEGLDERETRDVIRTDFSMQVEIQVARYGFYTDIIKKVGFDSTIKTDEEFPDDGIMYTISKDEDGNFTHTPTNYP